MRPKPASRPRCRVLSEAAGFTVEGEVGSAEPMAAIQDAVGRESFDEIVISTLPKRVSRWLHMDLPSKAGGLGPAGDARGGRVGARRLHPGGLLAMLVRDGMNPIA